METKSEEKWSVDDFYLALVRAKHKCESRYKVYNGSSWSIVWTLNKKRLGLEREESLAMVNELVNRGLVRLRWGRSVSFSHTGGNETDIDVKLIVTTPQEIVKCRLKNRMTQT